MPSLPLFTQSWQFNFFAYLFFHVVFFQNYKLAVRNVKKDGVATILLQLIAGISILILGPLFSFSFPKSPRIYLLLTSACVFYALHDRMQTTVRKNLQVSVFSILDQLWKVFLIAFGLLIFKEPFVLNKILGALLILGANVYLSYRKGRFEFNRYVGLAFLAAFIFAWAMSIDIGISRQFNLPFYIMFTLVVPALMIAFVEKINLKDVREEFLFSKDKKYYLITGLSWGLLIFFMLRAYRFGQVTVVTPLAATSVLINVLIAYVFLKERKDKLKKILAAILVIIGVYLTV
ncbi:MAG TPA: EamA family transporter [Candidatus Bathyarchaeia archaeon]|nr:EamA family transporter [Candidatus Bathyarchaeia archaeon]